MPQEKIIELRRLLAERHPHGAVAPGSESARKTAPTGLAPLDELLEGGLPQGAITEWVGEHPSSGSALALTALIQTLAESHQRVALVDGGNGFDPAFLREPALSQLLWAPCSGAAQAMQAADLLLRDGNLPWIFLDLRGRPLRELRGIQSTSWHRLQRLLDGAPRVLLALTPCRLISSARLRIALSRGLTLDAMSQTREEILRRLSWELQLDRVRKTTFAPSMEEAG